MNQPVIIIDAGHGGFHPDGGAYVTPGKRYEGFTEIGPVYEGVINRGIAQHLAVMLEKAGLEVHKAHHNWQDTNLWDRVKLERTLRERDKKDTIFVSIHNNAGGGQGMEIYTYPGTSESDAVATEIYNVWEEVIPQCPKRRPDWSDGDPDKEAEFYVLKHTHGPCVLVECGFMDNRQDAQFMLNNGGRQAYASAIFQGLKNYLNL